MFHYSPRFIALILTITAMGVSCSSDKTSNQQPKESGETFGFIGTEAPSLDIEHWISDGEGSFEHVTKFEPGKVYVVEFWATWCGPCIQAMPHIVQLQKDYADKGVQVISVTREPLATVNVFLQREVHGQSGTYADLTKSYCLTSDPDDSVYNDYMQAAGKNSIPTAFIVGKTGRIEWVGHPMAMEPTLASIIEDRWDRAAFGRPYQETHAEQEFIAELNDLLKTGKADEAAKLADAALAKASPTERRKILRTKWQVLLIGGETDGLFETTKELLDTNESPTEVNEICWTTYEALKRGVEIDKELLQLCAQTAAAAADTTAIERKGMILDTVAHLQFELGNLDEAIAIQTQAAELGGEQSDAVNKYLAELQAIKKSQKEEE